jgi:membrane protein
LTKLEKIILTKTPLAFLIKKSKKLFLPGFEGVPFYDVMKFFYKQVQTVGLTERASAIAYNFIMAVPPSFLFLFTLIPNLPLIKKWALKRELHAVITDIVPGKVYNTNIIKFVDSFIDDSRIGLLSFGLLLALFFASNAMMGLMRSFNKNYIGFAKRGGLRTRWMAIKLTALLFSLLLGFLIILITQSAVLKWAGIKNTGIRTFIYYVRWVFILALIYYSIAFIYKYAPAVEKKWKLVSPGTILATTLSIMATLGFTYFVKNFGRYNALYGSIGTIIVFMAMIYLNSLVLIIGFELNVSIKSLKSIADNRIAEEKLLAARQNEKL